jgi:hypothetical protein
MLTGGRGTKIHLDGSHKLTRKVLTQESCVRNSWLHVTLFCTPGRLCSKRKTWWMWQDAEIAATQGATVPPEGPAMSIAIKKTQSVAATNAFQCLRRSRTNNGRQTTARPLLPDYQRITSTHAIGISLLLSKIDMPPTAQFMHCIRFLFCCWPLPTIPRNPRDLSRMSHLQMMLAAVTTTAGK